MASFHWSARNTRNSFAAGTFFANFQIAYAFGLAIDTRLFGCPAGSSARWQLANTFGLVSSVVRYAEIASWTQHATPEARKRLSDASSHENTSGVIASSKSALRNRSPSRVSGESRRMFCPDGSASWPPKLNTTERRNRLASLQCENAMPHGLPLAFNVRPATRASSHVSGALRLLCSKRSLR